jgi:hypothetical protein
MGKVSLFLFVIGLVALVPAIVLTIFPWSASPFILTPSNWFAVVRAFITGFLYVFGLGLIVLGLIIVKRDSE